MERCFFNLRYPFWHDHDLIIRQSEMTALCRAALWYSEGVRIEGAKLHGIKALRECRDVTIEDCDVVSPEFGWSTDGIRMKDSRAESEYFLLRARNIAFSNVTFRGSILSSILKTAFSTAALSTRRTLSGTPTT